MNDRIIIDYTIKRVLTAEDLTGVREMVKDGWQPLGPPLKDEDGHLTQAMVRYDDNPSPIAHFLREISDRLYSLNEETRAIGSAVVELAE